MAACATHVNRSDLFKSFVGAVMAMCFAPANAIPASERQALLDLFNDTNGSAWVNNTGWGGTAGTECAWHGVTCSVGDVNVVNISLGQNNLNGILPASLNRLTALEGFAVYRNQLRGNIPPLTGLSALKYFYVYTNQLSGVIPSLVGLVALQEFDASDNLLTGAIPALAGLTALTSLSIDRNQLTGALPTLGAQSALLSLRVDDNQLTGAVPTAPASLGANQSSLCRNQFDTSTSAAWDTATGSAPWSNGCVSPRGPQVLTFAAPPVLRLADSGRVQANSSVVVRSPIAYQSLTPRVCSVTSSASNGAPPDGTVMVLATALAGDACVIAADSETDESALRDGVYNAAAQVQQRIIIQAIEAPVSVPALDVRALAALCALIVLSVFSFAVRRR